MSVWLDLTWIRATGPNIIQEPERIEGLEEESRGHLCPDMASAVMEAVLWRRHHPRMLLVTAHLMERSSGPLIEDLSLQLCGDLS